MTGVQRVVWQGIDDPRRADIALLDVGPDGMTGHGTSLTDAYALSWALTVGPGWISRGLTVSCHGTGWSRWLSLVRSEDGSWSSRTAEHGRTDLAPPGLREAVDVAGALDLDLALCPVTNTMPIRRLRLLEGSVAPTPLVVAWVDVPSLRVIRSDQVYGSDEGDVHYTSLTRGISTMLTTDPDGIVERYPGMAQRVREGGPLE